MKISVTIITRNREKDLRECLASLVGQTEKPDEVVMVDNGEGKSAKIVCDGFSDRLKLVYRKEKRVGVSYARNKAITVARGEIIGFVDDDCVVDKNWIVEIKRFFAYREEAVAVVGRTTNYWDNNVYAWVEHAYYLRWLGRNVCDGGNLLGGYAVDTKNLAVKAEYIKKIGFSTHPMFTRVTDEDVEMGVRLFRENPNIYLNERMKVSHKYSRSLRKMLLRNFWNGFENQRLRDVFGIDVRSVQRGDGDWGSKKDWKGLRENLRIERIGWFWVLVVVYPLMSRLGGVAAKLVADRWDESRTAGIVRRDVENLV